MSSMLIAGVLILVFLVALLISRWRYDEAEALYERFEFWRKAVGAAIAILLAATFIQSGDPVLIAATVILVVLAALWIAIEEPHKEVV